MRTIMTRTSQDSSLSFSKRHFQWINNIGGGRTSRRESDDRRRHEDDDYNAEEKRDEQEVDNEEKETLASSRCKASVGAAATAAAPRKKRGPTATAVSRFRAAFMSAISVRRWSPAAAAAMGNRVTGTLYGRRRGRVRFAFQVDPKSCPVLLLELATPTATLIREMASGLVRIALECEKRPPPPDDGGARRRKGGAADAAAGRRLLEEPVWRTYCNGKKCGYAVRRECGAHDWKVLRAVEPVSMGAGVLPAATAAEDGGGSAVAAAEEGEMMYMRARFERVVGSRDSEAFYMMNPDGNGGPELSIYLLRV